MFASSDFPTVPGLRGTCIAVAHKGEVAFVTAEHVTRGVEPGTRIAVPLGFGESQSIVEIAEVLTVSPSGPEYEDACDVAVLKPSSTPAFVEDESLAVDLAIGANMATAETGKSLFAICGYPRNHPNGNMIDYERRAADFVLFHAIGAYAGPSPLPGCHQLDVSTAQVGGPDGFSGGPAFRIWLSGEAWQGILAGLVIRGGVNRVHFIENSSLLGIVAGVLK